MRGAVDAYMADHDGGCPAPALDGLGNYTNFEIVPKDAWGKPLRLECPGGDHARYDLSAATARMGGLLDSIESSDRHERKIGVMDQKRIVKALRRTAERGVTLVEVLIVVAIIAMVASGVAVFALPKYKEAQVKSAETGARVIRGAIQNWQRVNNESSCPTMSQLVQEKELDSATTTDDPWGDAYILSCTDDDVIVASNGPDKKKGTPDDIRVPKGVAASGN